MQNNYEIIEIKNIKDFLNSVLKIYKGYTAEDYKIMEWYSNGPMGMTGVHDKELLAFGTLYLFFKNDAKHNKKWLFESNDKIYWYKPVAEEGNL